MSDRPAAVGASWLNSVQTELIELVAAAGSLNVSYGSPEALENALLFLAGARADKPRRRCAVNRYRPSQAAQRSLSALRRRQALRFHGGRR